MQRLSICHVLLQHSFKHIDNFLTCDLKVEVPVYDLPASIAWCRVPAESLHTRNES